MRTAEIANLKQWIVQDNCRLVTLLGMVELAKPLAVKLVEQVQDKFEYVICDHCATLHLPKIFTELILFLSPPRS